MRRTNRSSAEVRQDLLEATVRLVAQRGVAAVTYRDIAAAAGASDSVLLRHFGTKNDLIVAAVVEPFTDALAELVDHPDRTDLLGELHAVLSAHRSVVRTLLAAEVAGVDDPVLAASLSRLRAVLGRLAAVDRQPGEDDDLTARAVIAMTVAVAALDDVLFAGPARPAEADLVTALTAFTAQGRAGGR